MVWKRTRRTFGSAARKSIVERWDVCLLFDGDLNHGGHGEHGDRGQRPSCSGTSIQMGELALPRGRLLAQCDFTVVYETQLQLRMGGVYFFGGERALRTAVR